MPIIIQTFVFNFVAENTYVLSFPNKNAILIDPGCYSNDEKRVLLAYLNEHQLTIKEIWLTHAHVDHVVGLAWASLQFGVVPKLHIKDLPVLNAVPSYAPNFGFNEVTLPESLAYFESDSIHIEGHEVQVLFAPGHSPGSVCFYFKEGGFAIAGDVLFKESIGRTDLPGGDYHTLIESIRTQLFVLPETTIIYPGHGSTTTIGHEKIHNPFLT